MAIAFLFCVHTYKYLMNPIIKIVPEKKLIGKRIKMTLADNKTFELWKSFMPRRKEIKNNLTTELVSRQVYDKSLDFKDFNQDRRLKNGPLLKLQTLTQFHLKWKPTC